MRFSHFARYYTPIVCLMALAFLNFLSKQIFFDPLTAAQNPRLEFQANETTSLASDLSPFEAHLAELTLSPDFEDSPETLHVMYTGNSQTMAIMDRLPGDLVSAQWLQILLARQGITDKSQIEVRQGSLPNLSMTEFLIKLVAAGERKTHPVDVYLGAIVLEEWRNVGMREEVLSVVQSQSVNDELAKLIASNPDLQFANKALAFVAQTESSDTPTASGPQEAVRGLLAANLESRLQAWTDEIIPLFAKRPQLRGWLVLKSVGLRNRILGITSATVRPVPEGTYNTSLELLELSLRYARSKGIHVILYLAPIRPIQPNPNLPTDVARFRWDVSKLCQRYDVTCLDYTDLIPEQLWTNYPDDSPGLSGQRDYAHFTGSAHKRLAEQMVIDVGPLFAQWAQRKVDHQP